MSYYEELTRSLPDFGQGSAIIDQGVCRKACSEVERLRALSATQAKTIQSLTDTLALCEQRAGRLQRHRSLRAGQALLP